MNARRFGPKLTADGVTFRLWAPAAKRVDLLLDSLRPMVRGDNGWFSLDVATAKAGTRYKFRIDGEITCPTPPRASSPRTCSVQARRSITALTLGVRGIGAAGHGKRPC